MGPIRGLKDLEGLDLGHFGILEVKNHKTLRNVVFEVLISKMAQKQHIGNFRFRGDF